MSTSYHITGWLTALSMLLTWAGLISQYREIERRKIAFAQRSEQRERPTAILSTNQFVSSFLAFFAFFIYGMSLEPFNHYLVWPRLGATLLTILILWEIMRDRHDLRSCAAFWGCSGTFILVSLLTVSGPSLRESIRVFSQVMIVILSLIILQGYSHQALLLFRERYIGAVSWRLHLAFLGKDMATIAFAITMGSRDGWPLMLLCGVSALTKATILGQIIWLQFSHASNRE